MNSQSTDSVSKLGVRYSSSDGGFSAPSQDDRVDPEPKLEAVPEIDTPEGAAVDELLTLDMSGSTGGNDSEIVKCR